MNIEAITDDAWERLHFYASGATCIRAVMAFWTIPFADLPDGLRSGFLKEKSYLCVDINAPTSISALNSLHQAGLDVGLHVMTTTGKSEIQDSVGMPNHLMHSKVMIFDYADRDSIIWVGSHNATFRALCGTNYECTLAVQASPDSELYSEVLNHITEINGSCHRFRSNLVDHYRHLQGAKIENAVSVMELENSNDQPLAIGEEITVFRISRNDMQSIKTIDTDVIVSLHGSSEKLYVARIVQAGETPLATSQSFSDRRYADRQNQTLPVLRDKTVVASNMYRQSTYFASLKIERNVTASHRLLEIPNTSAWVDLPANSHPRFTKLTRVGYKHSEYLSSKTSGLKIKVPAFEEFAGNDLEITPAILKLRESAFKELALSEKRAMKRPTLIKRKLMLSSNVTIDA